MPGYTCVWEYSVAPENQDAFHEAYGPDGAWVRLFRRAPGYVRTELHRDRLQSDRFLTIDYWESEAAWQVFRSTYTAEYEALDEGCAALTQREAEIGRFGRVE